MSLPARTKTLLISAALLAAPAARADVSAAARAFSDGQTAQLEGDYDHAAQSFELAYSNAPSKEALRSAIRARQLAGQLARAATLAELLLVKYPDDAPSTKLASDVIAEAKPKLGRVTVTCAPRCSLAIGGRAMSLPAAETQVVDIAAGRHTLEATFDDARTASRDIAAVAGADSDVRLVPAAPSAAAAPAAAPAPQPRAEAEVKRSEPAAPHGLPRFVALTGAAIAVGLAGVGVWSGLDTNKARDTYVKNPTHAAFTAGQSKQLRTNILFGSAIAVGAATAVVAVWWTRWSGKETPPPVALAPLTDGALVTYGGHF
ncbi:MAG TPA: hypothetical protein VHW23_34845 [Kofleriaceae bacterium]|nr:hypothetical protein [Kofleriaceae bacterium]